MRSRSYWALGLVVAGLLAVVSPAGAVGVIGVRGGVSIASADVDSAEELIAEDNRTGFAGTGFVTLGLGVLTLQPEVSYIQKGTDQFHLDYVELAGLLKFGLPIIPVIKPSLFAGVGADFEASSDADEFSVQTNSTDWNLIVGADVNIALSRMIVIGDVRYAVGLSDISSPDDVFGDVKNRAWLISAGLGWQF
jgi:hypothetical protein